MHLDGFAKVRTTKHFKIQQFPRVRGRVTGLCWQCGAGDHFQRDCLTGGKGAAKTEREKALLLLSAALSSWRPPMLLGPTANQWIAFIPQPWKGKGKIKISNGAEGKGKSGDIEMGAKAYVGCEYTG